MRVAIAGAGARYAFTYGRESTDDAQVQTADGSGVGNNQEQDPDQVGSINDYQTQQSEMASNGFYVVVPMRPLIVRPPLGANPPAAFVPFPRGAMIGSRPIMIPPRSIGPFPSTPTIGRARLVSRTLALSNFAAIQTHPPSQQEPARAKA